MRGPSRDSLPGMSAPESSSLLTRVVTAVVLFVLSLVLLLGLADKIDARLVGFGEDAWPGYASQLRNDPEPPVCDVEQAKAALETCIPDTAPAGGAATGDPFAPAGDGGVDDPFAAPGDGGAVDDPFAAPAAGAAVDDPFAAPAGEAATDDPFAAPAGDAATDDPFADGAAAGTDDPFATGGAVATAPRVPCAAAEALVSSCAAQHDRYT